MYYHDGTRFYITLVDEDGNLLTNTKVIMSINGANYERTTGADGKTSLPLDLISGVYSLTVIYDGSTTYEKATATFKVNIKSTISAVNVTKIFRNDTQYYAKFLDNKGNPLVGAKVVFNINGVFYYRTTDSNGQAKLIINLNPAKYIITAEGPNGEKASNVVNVLPNMIGGDVTKYYRNGTQYKITLLDKKGNPAAGARVTFNINGVFYTRTADSNGVATLGINLPPGKYILTAQYEGAQISNNVEVLNTIASSDLVMSSSYRKKFTVTVLDDVGKVASGCELSFNIHGIMYYRVSNADGTASLNINLMPGIYLITTYYGTLAKSDYITIY